LIFLIVVPTKMGWNLSEVADEFLEGAGTEKPHFIMYTK
jgi:hypothetical protein